jgi:mRNA-degrading endonuclease HigB of HigAB toxin-antitoxin module
MILLNYEEVERFTRKHASARAAFNRWRDRTKKASWQDFEAVKRDFPAADKYRAC